MKQNVYVTISVLLVGVLIGVGGFYLVNQDEGKLGSVTVGNEYNSTTTLSTNFKTQALGSNLLKTGQGVIGQVVISKAGAAGATWSLVDATTTSALLRTNTATTTIVTFPTDAAAGTYTFDTTFKYGLLLEYSTSMGTTTIMTR